MLRGLCVQRAGDGVGAVPAGGAADAGAGGATGDDVPVGGCEPADAAVGRGGTGPGAAPGCGGIGIGEDAALGPVCGVGTGPAPSAGRVGTGDGPCATLKGGIGPPELVTGTGPDPCATVIGGVGPLELVTGTRWLSASADFDAGRVPTTATGFFRPSSKVISSPA
jgi:hypothetical protein